MSALLLLFHMINFSLIMQDYPISWFLLSTWLDGQRESLKNKKQRVSAFCWTKYCQATGTGDGDGNPVQGDDSIISQATHPPPTTQLLTMKECSHKKVPSSKKMTRWPSTITTWGSPTWSRRSYQQLITFRRVKSEWPSGNKNKIPVHFTYNLVQSLTM